MLIYLSSARCSRYGEGGDPFFLPAGAEAFKRDNPGAEVNFYDTGHFALETHAEEIASTIRDFLGRKLPRAASAA
jgi:hypothetical protein